MCIYFHAIMWHVQRHDCSIIYVPTLNWNSANNMLLSLYMGVSYLVLQDASLADILPILWLQSAHPAHTPITNILSSYHNNHHYYRVSADIKALFSKTFQDLQRANCGVFQDSKNAFSRPLSSPSDVWGSQFWNLVQLETSKVLYLYTHTCCKAN